MARSPDIRIKRAYDPPAAADGVRLLVDRLWPRGLKKESARIDAWIREVAPSHELRRWFGHDPERWREFVRRYVAELNANPDAWRPILERAGEERVTLVYSAHDPEHNQARALLQYLERRGRTPRAKRAPAKRRGAPARKRSTKR